MERSKPSRSLLSKAQRRRLAWALLIALIGAAVATVRMDSNSSSAVIRGDFPAFYSMAVIASGDNPQQLYDLEEQARIQNEAWPSMKGSVLPAAYPPYVAYLAQPLVSLGPMNGKATFTLLSMVLFFVATVLLSRLSSALSDAPVELAVALLLFPPVLVGVLGGQLLALSMVLYVLMIFLDRHRDSTSEVVLGAVVGAWSFKPHYALLALIIFLVQGRFRVLLGFTIPALIYFILGMAVLGIDWLPQWVLFTRDFAEMNFASNAAQMSNVVGGTLALAKILHLEFGATQLVRVLALGVCGLVVIALVTTAWRDRQTMPIQGTVCSRVVLLLGPVLAFASPQANFYDLGLAVIPLVLLLKTTMRDWLLVFGGCVLLASLAVTFKKSGLPLFLPVSLVILVAVTDRVMISTKKAKQK